MKALWPLLIPMERNSTLIQIDFYLWSGSCLLPTLRGLHQQVEGVEAEVMRNHELNLYNTCFLQEVDVVGLPLEVAVVDLAAVDEDKESSKSYICRISKILTVKSSDPAITNCSFGLTAKH